MGKTNYMVYAPILIGIFNDIENAMLFVKAYMNENAGTPDLEVTIKRKSPNLGSSVAEIHFFKDDNCGEEIL